MIDIIIDRLTAIPGSTVYENEEQVVSSDLSSEGLECLVDGVTEAENHPDPGSIINGLSEISILVDVTSTAVGHDRGIFICSVTNGSDDFLGMRYDNAGANGGGDDLIKYGTDTTDGLAINESSSNSQVIGNQHLVMTWRSGEHPKLFIDGVEDTPTYTRSIRNGTITGVTNIFIGEGPLDTTDGVDDWPGTINSFKVFDRALTDSEIADLYNGTAPGATIQPGTPFVLEGPVSGRLFRVVGVNESDKHIYQLTCVQHDPTKYAYIEQGITLPSPVYTDLAAFEVATPSGIAFTENSSYINGQVVRELIITWDNPTNERIKLWKSYYKVNGVTYNLPDVTHNEVTIPAQKDGVYEFHLVAVNWRNVSSPKAVASHTINGGVSVLSNVVGAPTDRRRKGSGLADADRFKFYTGDLAITWGYDYDTYPEPAGWLLRIDSASTPAGQYTTAGRDFVYSYAMNEADHDGVAIRNPSIYIAAVDGFGRRSVWHSATFTNDAPNPPSLQTFSHFDRIDVLIDEPVDRDIALYQVWASTTNPPAQTAQNLVFEGTDRRFSVAAPAGTWYIRAKAVDTFGLPTKTGTLGSVYTENSLSYDIPTEQEILDAIEADRLEDYELGSYELDFSVNAAGTTIYWSSGYITRLDNRTGTTANWFINPGSWDHTQAGRVNVYFDTDNPGAGLQFSYDWRDASGKASLILIRHQNGTQLIQVVHGNGRLSLDRLYSREIEGNHLQIGTGNVLELRALSITAAEIASDSILARMVGANEVIANTSNINVGVFKTLLTDHLTATEIGTKLLIANKANIDTGVFEDLFAENVIVNNANIGNVIQSNTTGYGGNPVWKLDKLGNVTIYGALRVYNNDTGNVILNAGGVNWQEVTGSGVPEDNSTNGATWDTNLFGRPDGELYNADDATVLGTNPTFSDWTGTYPAGWSAWGAGGVSKATYWVVSGLYSMEFTANGTANQGAQKFYTPSTLLPARSLIEGTLTVRYNLNSGTAKPGMLVRVVHNDDSYNDTTVQPANQNTWETIPFAAGGNGTGNIKRVEFYLMAAWSGFPGGFSDCTVYFDTLRFSIKHPTTRQGYADNLLGSFNQTAFDTYMSSVFIKTAHIQNLAVESLKIKDAAVTSIVKTTPADYTKYYSGYTNDTWVGCGVQDIVIPSNGVACDIEAYFEWSLVVTPGAPTNGSYDYHDHLQDFKIAFQRWNGSSWDTLVEKTFNDTYQILNGQLQAGNQTEYEGFLDATANSGDRVRAVIWERHFTNIGYGNLSVFVHDMYIRRKTFFR